MNIEDVRNYCLTLACAKEGMPFDDTVVVFKVGNDAQNKIFAFLSVTDKEYLILKCDPTRAVELREQYENIEGAYHCNKTHWNGIKNYSSMDEGLMREMIDHSYNLVRGSLKKSVRDTLQQLG